MDVTRRGRMCPADEERIRRHFLYLKQEIRATDLLDSLITTLTIDVKDGADIRKEQDQNQSLLETLLHRGPLAYPGFITALQESGYPHVAKKLEDSKQENKDEATGAMFQTTYTRIQQVQETINGIQHKFNKVKGEPVGVLQGLVAEVRSFEEDLENKKCEIKSLKEENRQKDVLVFDMKRDLSSKEEQLLQNKSLVENLSRKVSDLEETCSQQKNNMAKLKEEVLCNENVVEKQKVSLGKCQQTLKTQSDTISKLRTDLQDQGSTILSMENEMSQLGKCVREMESTNKEQKLMIGKQRDQIAQQCGEIQKLHQRSVKVDALESCISSLRNDLTQKDLTIQRHRNELDREVKRNANNFVDLQRQLTSFETRQSMELQSHQNCLKVQAETMQHLVNSVESLSNSRHKTNQGNAVKREPWHH